MGAHALLATIPNPHKIRFIYIRSNNATYISQTEPKNKDLEPVAVLQSIEEIEEDNE